MTRWGMLLLAAYVALAQAAAAEIRREDPVQRDGRRICGPDLPPRHPSVRESVPQDRPPPEGGRGGLDETGRNSGDDVDRGDPGDRIPELLAPAPDVPAEELSEGSGYDEDEPAVDEPSDLEVSPR